MSPDPPSTTTSSGTPSAPGRSGGTGSAPAGVSPSSTRSSIVLQAHQLLRHASRRSAALNAARALDRSFDREYDDFNNHVAALDAQLDRLESGESVSDADLSRSILALSPLVGSSPAAADGRPTPRTLSDSFGDRDPASVQRETAAALADDGLVLQDRSLVGQSPAAGDLVSDPDDDGTSVPASDDASVLADDDVSVPADDGASFTDGDDGPHQASFGRGRFRRFLGGLGSGWGSGRPAPRVSPADGARFVALPSVPQSHHPPPPPSRSSGGPAFRTPRSSSDQDARAPSARWRRQSSSRHGPPPRTQPRPPPDVTFLGVQWLRFGRSPSEFLKLHHDPPKPDDHKSIRHFSTLKSFGGSFDYNPSALFGSQSSSDAVETTIVAFQAVLRGFKLTCDSYHLSSLFSVLFYSPSVDSGVPGSATALRALSAFNGTPGVDFFSLLDPSLVVTPSLVSSVRRFQGFFNCFAPEDRIKSAGYALLALLNNCSSALRDWVYARTAGLPEVEKGPATLMACILLRVTSCDDAFLSAVISRLIHFDFGAVKFDMIAARIRVMSMANWLGDSRLPAGIVSFILQSVAKSPHPAFANYSRTLAINISQGAVSLDGPTRCEQLATLLEMLEKQYLHLLRFSELGGDGGGARPQSSFAITDVPAPAPALPSDDVSRAFSAFSVAEVSDLASGLTSADLSTLARACIAANETLARSGKPPLTFPQVRSIKCHQCGGPHHKKHCDKLHLPQTEAGRRAEAETRDRRARREEARRTQRDRRSAAPSASRALLSSFLDNVLDATDPDDASVPDSPDASDESLIAAMTARFDMATDLSKE